MSAHPSAPQRTPDHPSASQRETTADDAIDLDGEEIVPAWRAAELLACHPQTLKRWARTGYRNFTRLRHPERTGYFYLRSEIERERAGFRKVSP